MKEILQDKINALYSLMLDLESNPTGAIRHENFEDHYKQTVTLVIRLLENLNSSFEDEEFAIDDAYSFVAQQLEHVRANKDPFGALKSTVQGYEDSLKVIEGKHLSSSNSVKIGG